MTQNYGKQCGQKVAKQEHFCSSLIKAKILDFQDSRFKVEFEQWKIGENDPDDGVYDLLNMPKYVGILRILHPGSEETALQWAREEG